MHKLTQINRNNFPVAPEKDIAVESFAEDNKGTVSYTHLDVYKRQITYIAKSTNNQYFLASSHKIYCARLNHGRLEMCIRDSYIVV